MINITLCKNRAVLVVRKIILLKENWDDLNKRMKLFWGYFVFPTDQSDEKPHSFIVIMRFLTILEMTKHP